MNRFGERPAAAERGRWLAELAEAVTEAQRLARSLSIAKGNHAEAEDLYGRLELVRIEVEDLRRAGRGARRASIDPFWANLFPGNGRPKF